MPKKTTSRKPKIVDAPINVIAGEEKLVMFGWCSTGHHDGCSVSFPGHKCSCECHEKEDNNVKED